ncbi:MAG: ASPIC/UnbV domain-containing protein, partial [Myxococcota bacterium]
DGRLDVVLAPAVGRPLVLQNVSPGGHYLAVRLRGRGGNPEGVGAWVTVGDSERILIRERRLGDGYLGNHDPRLHFGLPTTNPVDIDVRWPSGVRTTLRDVSVDQELEIREP